MFRRCQVLDQMNEDIGSVQLRTSHNAQARTRKHGLIGETVERSHEVRDYLETNDMRLISGFS